MKELIVIVQRGAGPAVKGFLKLSTAFVSVLAYGERDTEYRILVDTKLTADELQKLIWARFPMISVTVRDPIPEGEPPNVR